MCVDEMLQDGKDVREGSGGASEGSKGGCRQLVHVLPMVAASVNYQWSEVLHVLDGISDAQLGQRLLLPIPPSAVTAHREEGRLRTQDRHEANGVSNVRTARKRACLVACVSASSCLH